MARPDDIAFNAMKDGGKKMDLFGESFWYSDTTHVREPFQTITELEAVGQRWDPNLYKQEDIVLPLMGELNYDERRHPYKGEISVNTKNLVGARREANPKEGKSPFIEVFATGAGSLPIWGDILDEAGKKTGRQILLETTFNVLEDETGNITKHPWKWKGKNTLQNLIAITYPDLPLRKYGKHTDIGLKPKMERRQYKSSKQKYIYKDEDGTQYYSSQAPYGESKE